MSRFVDIKLLGSRSLQKKLNRMAGKVQSKVMRDATKKALEPVKTLALQKVPVESGRLKKSLTIVVSRGRNLGAVLKVGSRSKLKISADDPYFYPAALEYGTDKIRPFAYLRGALAERKKQALGILRREIRQMLKGK